MEKAVVAVGSNRIQKLAAVREALESFANKLDPNVHFEVVGVGVAVTGVSDMPRSRAELMAGARGRTESLIRLARKGGDRWRYFVGLEGGLDVTMENGKRLTFLESWAFVSDGLGREAYGYAGGILLPARLADEVLDRGAELGAAIDAYTGCQGIANGPGAWGVLTGNLISRQESCRIAVIHAFAPFFNAPLYS